MSETSESVPQSLGAMGRYSLVFESKTATFETLAKTVPLRCSTSENWPPSQMLDPTCSMARTRPSIMGVSSGISEGNARAAPVPRRVARAIEANSRMVLLILFTLLCDPTDPTIRFRSYGQEVRLAPALASSKTAEAPLATSEANLPSASTCTALGVPEAPKARPAANLWSKTKVEVLKPCFLLACSVPAETTRSLGAPSGWFLSHSLSSGSIL